MLAPKEFRNFSVKDGVLFMHSGGRDLLCIPEGARLHEGLVRETIINEAHSLLAHLGADKTIAYLRDHVWWKTLIRDVRIFCAACQMCKRSKPSNQRPFSLLNSLQVPSRPWQAIGVDFVGPLPSSSNRDGTFNSITVMIDLLSSMVHLIPSRIDYTTPQVAELMFKNVFKLHGLPEHIISDRDVLFTSEFWTSLHRLMGVGLKMSSSYHPQTDGSTECANCMVTQMIRACISPDQKDWVARLPGIQFAINSSTSDSTGFAPFYVNYGQVPRSFLWMAPSNDVYPGVREFALWIKHTVLAAHDSIFAAHVKQT